MASASCCSVCPKGAGTCYCPGCNTYFCNRDFRNHRDMLVHKLDELTVDRNELQEKISKTSLQKHSNSSLLSQIDAWQEETIQKVKHAAELARQQALEMLNSKQEEMARQFQTLSQEMGHLRETEDVLEQDLSRLKNQIEQLHEGLENAPQPPTIELNTKQSEQIMWDRMIYVQDRSALSSQDQKPLASDGEYFTI